MSDYSRLLYVKSLTIEGFGRFQEPTTIELAPVTFLIGPNGAGKSTVGKVLMLVHEVFAKGNVAPNNRYRGEQGECKVWWSYHEDLGSTHVGFGVRIAYGSTPKIISYLLAYENEIALEWEEEVIGIYGEPPWTCQHLDFNDEKGLQEVSYHASGIGKKINKIDAKFVDRNITYRVCKPNLLQQIITDIQVDHSEIVADSNLINFVKCENLDNSTEIENDLTPHTMRMIRPYRINDEGENTNFTNDTSENESLNIYLPSDFKILRQSINGPGTIETLLNLGHEIELLCIVDVIKLVKSLGDEPDFDRLDKLTKYSFTKALITRAARPGINSIKEFVKSYRHDMPVRLASKLRDFVPLFDERPIEKAVRIFANQSDSMTLKEFVDGPGDTLIKDKKSFFKALPQFGSSDILVVPAGTQAYQFKLELNNHSLTDLKDMGTGFRAMLAIYAWLISNLQRPELALSAYPYDDPEKDHLHYDPTSQIRINSFDLLYLEEIESALHPAAQSKLFQLILDASPTRPGFVSVGATFFQEETKGEENVRKQSSREEREADQLVPRRPLIFETHSEYIVRSALNMVASGDRSADHFAINYIHAPGLQPEGKPAAFHIGIRDNGTLMREFGPGFFDESQRLRRELIDLNTTTPEQRN